MRKMGQDLVETHSTQKILSQCGSKTCSVPDRILLYSTFTSALKKKAPNNNGRCTPSAIQKRKKKKCRYSGTFNEVEMLGCGLCLIKCDHYCLHCEELDETAVQNASLHGSYCFVLYLLAS